MVSAWKRWLFSSKKLVNLLFGSNDNQKQVDLISTLQVIKMLFELLHFVINNITSIPAAVIR